MPSEASAKPTFACRIPAELLPHDEKERRFYTQSDVMDQKMDWLLSASIAQGAKLEEVRVQATKTNGSVARVIQDIDTIKGQAERQKEDVAPVVKAYGIAKTLAKSRLFWVGAAAFVVFGLPALISVAPAPIAFLRAAVTILFGI